MDETGVAGGCRRSWALAVVSAFLFALGGVATWAQELEVWIPQRAASVCILLGLLCGFVSLLLAARALFRGPALSRRQQWTILWAILLAAIPPLVFLTWAIWMRVSLAAKL